MIDVTYSVLEDALRTKKSNVDIFEGQPVKLDSNGQLVPATADAPIYGIAKLDANQYRNFAYGEVGAYGSGKLTVILSGIIKVKASVFDKIEVDQSGSTSSPVTVKIYDDSKTYTPGDILYIDGSGLITNAASDKHSIFGKVVSTPATSGDWLEILIEPMIAVAASQIAA